MYQHTFSKFFLLGIVAVISQSLGIIISLNTSHTIQQSCEVVGTTYCQILLQNETRPHLILSLILIIVVPIYTAFMVWYWSKDIKESIKHLLVIVSADTLALLLYWTVFLMEIV